VSRSYLQSDSAVKKISSYITKKVASRLEDIFKSDRKDFESKWDDIKLFIEYGMLTDEKFCEAAMKFAMLKDTEGQHFTFEEYKTLVETEQTDKDGNIVYLYATDAVAQYNYIKAATDKGYNVLVMDGQLDSHFVGLLEQKLEKTHLVRVDSDVVENLIVKSERKTADLSGLQRTVLTELFRCQLPKVDKAEFLVSFEALSANDMPIVITQSEYMRRMKDMAALQPGMSFYGEMPDSYNLVVNTEHPLIANIRDNSGKALDATVKPIDEAINANNAEIEKLRKDSNAENDQRVKDLEKTVSDDRQRQATIIADYAKTQPVVKQLIDLALLGNGLLRGSDLSAFIHRSVDLIK
jgi:molecular chaperone HtpG